MVDELVGRLLERGYAADGLHGDVSQAQREKILHKFKKKYTNIMVATDVAARGIDVSNLTHVINYSLPQDSESYVHRIGRTGRAGNQGTAITFISHAEYRQFVSMRKAVGGDIRKEEIPSVQDVIALKKAQYHRGACRGGRGGHIRRLRRYDRRDIAPIRSPYRCVGLA